MPDAPDVHWKYLPAPRSPEMEAWGCTLSGFEEWLPHPVRRLEVPAPVIKLIIGFGARYRLSFATEGARSHQSFIVGLGGGPAVSDHAAAQSCIEVALPPWAAYRLFDGASDVLSSPVVDLADAWGGQASLLSEQLHHAVTWEARFALVEQDLTIRLRRARREAGPELRWAWNELERRHGNVSIASLRRAIGWSERHLSAQFRRQLGITPKLAARRLRFDRVLGSLDASAAIGLADIAAECGYADQSHLSREFRAFAGCAPQAYRQAGLPGALGKPATLLAG
ncbi:helix-turn-helix domain-containing protein [Variovorax sp. M-6]|uniref:AraC family transcriptional regulator n=1 Tax=Variovorax sp. M-6 TaxID=3233041 RepID=UPI003F98DC5A